jgi:hypothetical protein
MKTRILTATAGAVLAAGVMWSAPSASANTPYCDSLPKPQQAHECNCGFDFAPGSPEFDGCMKGNAAAPAAPKP